MNGILRVKLRRDLRASWSRVVLMVVAITVSLTVFGGVLLAWSALGRETAAAYIGTEPASATILLDRPIDVGEMAEIVEVVASRPDVLAATGRTQFDGEIQINGRPRSIPLQVFVAPPDDPLRVARFEVESGSWPPSAGEILVGRDSLTLLDVAVGDSLSLVTPVGERLELRVAATVYDPSLAPAAQEQRGHAYLSAAALEMAGAAVGLDQLKLQIADPGEDVPTRDRAKVVAAAGDVGEWLQREYGLVVREIQVPEPYAHPHQWQADALLLSLLAGGAAALLLSAILVATMLNGMFTQQIPQIGILKAIGARSRDVGGFYLLLTILIAAAATLLALLPAGVIGRALLEQVFGFLGIRGADLTPPAWAYAALVGAGLGLPPMMALAPLLRTSRTTVRAAIDHHAGAATPSAATGVVARLSRIERLDRGLLLALRNTVRHPARFILSVGLLASAGTVFVAGVSLSAGVGAVTEEETARRTWDVDLQVPRPAAFDELAAALDGLPGVRRIEALRVAPTGVAGPGRLPVTRTYPDQGHGRITVTAIPSGTTTLAQPKMLEGRWLAPEETGAVVLTQVARNTTVPDVRPGDTVQLLVAGRPTTWRVVGIAEERGGAVYTTAEGFAAALGVPQAVNQVRIVTDAPDEATRTRVAAAAAATLAEAGFEGASAASVSRREAISEGHLGPLITIVMAIAVAMGLIGGIGLASTMSTNVLDRTREFGVMHAIGARPQRVRGIVTAEAIFLAIASVIAAIVPMLLLTALLGAGLGNLFFSAPLPYRVSVLAFVIWSAIAVLGSILATEAAATRASRLTVREALAYL